MCVKVCARRRERQKKKNLVSQQECSESARVPATSCTRSTAAAPSSLFCKPAHAPTHACSHTSAYVSSGSCSRSFALFFSFLSLLRLYRSLSHSHALSLSHCIDREGYTLSFSVSLSLSLHIYIHTHINTYVDTYI